MTLKAPSGNDYSVIVETIDATEPQDVEFQISGGLSTGTIHVWETNAIKSFEKAQRHYAAERRLPASRSSLMPFIL